MSSSLSVDQKFTPKGAWLRSCDPFEILEPLHIFGTVKDRNFILGVYHSMH